VAGLADEERPEVPRLGEKLWSKGSPILVQAAFRLTRIRLSKAPFGIAWNQNLILILRRPATRSGRLAKQCRFNAAA
jgi:hypothetical protein